MTHNLWFITGQAFFGFLIGVLCGLSISPVVGTLFGLLFFFIGGSLLVLITGKTDHQIKFIGKSLSALSLFMVLGASSGIYLRANDLLTKKSIPLFQLDAELTVEDIVKISKTIDSPETICTIMRHSFQHDGTQTINKKYFVDMITNNKTDVDTTIYQYMFVSTNQCKQDEIVKANDPKGNTHLMKSNPSEEEIKFLKGR